MAHKLGIAGIPNSGKSFSRRTIKDGENVFILMPSVKATHIKDSKGKPLKRFDISTPKFKNKAEYIHRLNAKNVHMLISYMNSQVKPGLVTKDMIKGNVEVVKNLVDLPIWLEFISKHLTWIHTVIIPDFTHFISEVIATDEFISRKAGGEAYQRFWELAASALRNFVLSIDNYREDLIVVTEYHAEFDENIQGFDIFSPAGKMLKEKFLVPSYYDILLFTDVETTDGGKNNYRFVTDRTQRYPFARAMNIFGQTYIDNDLQLVLTKMREYLAIELKETEEEIIQ